MDRNMDRNKNRDDDSDSGRKDDQKARDRESSGTEDRNISQGGSRPNPSKDGNRQDRDR
jgi:hypothetical protein